MALFGSIPQLAGNAPLKCSLEFTEVKLLHGKGFCRRLGQVDVMEHICEVKKEKRQISSVKAELVKRIQREERGVRRM